MDAFPVLAAIQAALACLLLAAAAAGEVRRRRLRRRLREVTAPVELTRRPRLPRFLAPAEWLGGHLALLLPDRVTEALALQLQRAGDPAGLTMEHLLGLRVIVTTSGLYLAALLQREIGGWPGVVVAAIVAMLAVAGLDGWLLGRAAERKKRIERDLTIFVDLLHLALASGMALDPATATIAERARGPLADEARRYLAAMSELGMPRRAALVAMALRVGSPQLSFFTESLAHATETGAGLMTTLASQARLLRDVRRRAAESSAQRAPIRMMFPMTLFILPVLMLVVLGPVALRLFIVTGGGGS